MVPPRSEEVMPIGNWRMASLVWTTTQQLRFQINRADAYANSLPSFTKGSAQSWTAILARLQRYS